MRSKRLTKLLSKYSFSKNRSVWRSKRHSQPNALQTRSICPSFLMLIVENRFLFVAHWWDQYNRSTSFWRRYNWRIFITIKRPFDSSGWRYTSDFYVGVFLSSDSSIARPSPTLRYGVLEPSDPHIPASGRFSHKNLCFVKIKNPPNPLWKGGISPSHHPRFRTRMSENGVCNAI